MNNGLIALLYFSFMVVTVQVTSSQLPVGHLVKSTGAKFGNMFNFCDIVIYTSM